MLTIIKPTKANIRIILIISIIHGITARIDEILKNT